MNRRLKVFLTATLLGLLASESRADSDHVVVGDPAMPAQLPRALLEAYAHGARDITIIPGTYLLPATSKDSIELNSWEDVSIHAAGVTIVFQELAHRPIRLRRCERVTFDGATLRFAQPAFTQGRIKNLGQDAQGAYLDWQIDAGYPSDLDPAQATFDVADQNTRLIKTGTGDVGFRLCERLTPGLFRLRQVHGRIGAAAVNDWLFTRIKDAGSTVVHLDGCGHCTMRDVTLQNSGFAAFFETHGEGAHAYIGCRVSPGPKPEGATEEQLVGCGADGFHSAGTRTGPTINRCVWEGLLHDDCIAIHGYLQKVERVEGSTLLLEKGNRGGFAVGEPVRISSKNGFFGEFTCVALRTLEGGILELTLDRESGAPAEAKASNPRCDGAHFRILNCTLGNCRSRGILVKADHGLIEGCTISGCGMSAISIGPEYYWGEADYSQHVTVRGNKLLNNVLNGSAAGVVFVHGDGAIGNGDIAITDNLFDRNYGQMAIHVEDTDSVRIAGNRFVASPLPLPDKARTILDFATTKNVSLQGNVVVNPAAKDSLVNLGKNVAGITGNDATGIAVAAEESADQVKHRFFKCGWASGGPAIYDAEFRPEWSLPDAAELSDGWVLPDHGVVFSYSIRGKEAGIIRLGPDKQQLWKYIAPDDHDNHSCQPLPGGGFLAGETARNGMWMVEIDKDGREQKRIKVGESTRDMHHTFRQVRRTAAGTYLAAVMNENKTYEWDANGKLLRTFPKGAFVAIRLPDGHTLVSAAHPAPDHGAVIEYDRDAQVVWELTLADIESLGIQVNMVCGVQRLPNGNTVITSVNHGKPVGTGDAVKAFEITRDKKLVWSIPGKTDPGNMGNLQILDVPGDVFQFEVLK